MMELKRSCVADDDDDDEQRCVRSLLASDWQAVSCCASVKEGAPAAAAYDDGAPVALQGTCCSLQELASDGDFAFAQRRHSISALTRSGTQGSVVF